MNRFLSSLQIGRVAIVVAGIVGLSTSAFASGLAGKYTSASKCSLAIEQLDMEAGMTEGYFKATSTGDGTCTWKGLGVAKQSHIALAGAVSLSAVLSFADLNWVFGPGGDQIQITFFDTEGKEINKQTFNRVK